MILARIQFRTPIFIPGQPGRPQHYDPADKSNAGAIVYVKDDVVMIVVPVTKNAGVPGEGVRAEVAAVNLETSALVHIIEVPRADCTFHWLALPESVKAYIETRIASESYPHPDVRKKPPAAVKVAPKPSAPKDATPAPAPAPTRRRDRNQPPGWTPPGPPSKPSVIIQEDLAGAPSDPPPAPTTEEAAAE